MSEITQILQAIQQGDPSAAGNLWSLVYEELKQIAGSKLSFERSDLTLQATALVHEVYLRLVRPQDPLHAWQNRGHFFSAAAEAMRRILVDEARRRNSQKRGGQRQRVALDDSALVDQSVRPPVDDLLQLDEALTWLETEAPDKAQLVKLRYFAGLTLEQTADSLGISVATAKRHWVYARAILFERLQAVAADDAATGSP